MVFIALELYGGYLAGSIAVFADSAHLGSDILGFMISMIALKLTHRGSTDSLSYGWHRAEIVGTLISIATMWIMTVWLLVEATHRIFEEPHIEGLTMIIVAVLGLVFNLIQIKILHQGDGHYHLGGDHDHGDHADCHGHGDEAAAAHDHKHDHKHDHAHDHKEEHKEGDTENPGHSRDLHDHAHSHNDHKHTHNQGACDHADQPAISDSARPLNVEEAPASETVVVAKEEDKKGKKDKKDKKKKTKTIRNINLDAALLHVMGDCIMSVGVIITAIIIYIWPEATVADPICTYFFGVIVAVTTVPVTKRCIRVLMEGTPEKFDTK